MEERIPQNRELEQTIADLIDHVKSRIDLLPELAEKFNLNPKAVARLKAYLTEELADLERLPSNVKLRDVIDYYFDRGVEVREIITGKK